MTFDGLGGGDEENQKTTLFPSLPSFKSPPSVFLWVSSLHPTPEHSLTITPSLRIPHPPNPYLHQKHLMDWREVMKRDKECGTHEKGNQKQQTKYVRGGDGFFGTSTLEFWCQICLLRLYINQMKFKKWIWQREFDNNFECHLIIIWLYPLIQMSVICQYVKFIAYHQEIGGSKTWWSSGPRAELVGTSCWLLILLTRY